MNKVRATFHLPEHVLTQARSAVIHLAGHPERLTLAALAERALKRELIRLQKKYNNGKAFPVKSQKLRGGRPIGT